MKKKTCSACEYFQNVGGLTVCDLERPVLVSRLPQDAICPVFREVREEIGWFHLNVNMTREEVRQEALRATHEYLDKQDADILTFISERLLEVDKN